MKDIAIKGAKAAFKAGDHEFPAGSLILPASDRARQEIEQLGLVAVALTSAPTVETVDVDLPRLAMYTTWANTEKVGWVRLAFDRFGIPFDLIHKDHVQSGANLRAKYDVIVMPHQTNGGKSIVYEQPKLSKPLPYKKNDKFKSMGMYAETDDVRGGMGLAGAAEFQKFVDEGGVLMTLGVASSFAADFGIAKGVEAQNPAAGFYAPGPYVQSEILLPNHPVMYGYDQKTLPVRFNGGPLLQAGPPQGFEQFAGSSPDRPQVIARFTGGEAGVLSGLMRNPDQIRNRPMVVDAPSGKGRVIMFANNPIYRWQTFGEHAMVFNSLMFWNDMDGGRRSKNLDARPSRSRISDLGFGSIDDLRSTITSGELFLRQALLPHFLDGLLHDFSNHLRAVLRIFGFAQPRPHQRILRHAEDQRFERDDALVAHIARVVHRAPPVAVVSPQARVVGRRPRRRHVSGAAIVVDDAKRDDAFDAGFFEPDARLVGALQFFLGHHAVRRHALHASRVELADQRFFAGDPQRVVLVDDERGDLLAGKRKGRRVGAFQTEENFVLAATETPRPITTASATRMKRRLVHEPSILPARRLLTRSTDYGCGSGWA